MTTAETPRLPTRRAQRRRTRGWRMPPGAVAVSRGTKWGNPFRVDPHGDPAAHARAVELFVAWYLPYRPDLVAAAPVELRGHALMCWCPPHLACHADALVELADTEVTQ